MSRTIEELKTEDGHAINSLRSEIELAKVTGKGLHERSPRLFYITEEAANIAPFNFPIVSSDGKEIYVDARGFTSVGKDRVSIKIRNEITAQYFDTLAYLELDWINLKNKDEMLFAFSDSLKHFANWIGENVSHDQRMDWNEKMRLESCAALYYVGLFHSHVEQGMQDTQLRRFITKHVMTNEESLDFVSADQEINYPRTIEEFCKFVADANINLQLNTFNPLMLKNIMFRTVFGIGEVRSVIELGLRHPPAFLAMVHTILQNSFLNKSALGAKLYKDSKMRDKFPATIQRRVEYTKEQ
jgi:hypothetical protein